MNRTELMEILPHRDNMLLVDEAEIVDELLAAGADPGARSSHGWTPLQEAVARSTATCPPDF